MKVEIRNCNNIDYTQIRIEENKLNIKYALNGTGKSTIANSIYSRIVEPEKIALLKPFKHKGDSSINPEINIDASINRIKIFNEKYINSFVYKKDELLNNSFEIFIKDEDYIKHQEEIGNIVKEIRNLFKNDEVITNLEKVLQVFIDDYKAAKNGWAANGVFGKGLAKGNKLHNIPQDLQVYKPFLFSENPVKWLKWQIDGNTFLPISDVCPFCSTENIGAKKEKIEKVKQEYEPKYVEHLSNMISLLDSLSEYISEDANEKIKAIKNNIDGLSDEQKNFIQNVNNEIQTLYKKVIEMKSIGFEELKDIDDIQQHISKLEINLDYLPDLNSVKMGEICHLINKSIQELLEKIIDLKKEISAQKRSIAQKIANNKKEINDFLEYAGYKYQVDIKTSNEDYKLVLYHNDYTSKEISEGNNILSYGEKNAFALILFMYDALKENADLIILDDPISSFDGTKKFAIINKLFYGKNSLKNKTVLLLTHDFNVIIDTIYNFNNRINVEAFFLENKNGELKEKEVKKENITSYKQIAMKNIKSDTSLITPLIYLRRLFEFEGEDNLGYQLLSNLFHKREVPIVKRDKSFFNMTETDIFEGEQEIKHFLPSFSYSEIISKIRDYDYLLAEYKTNSIGYEKLQIYRALNLVNPVGEDSNDKLIITQEDNAFKKFVNETFHIENDYLYQLNPIEYEVIPNYVVEKCDKYVKEIEDKFRTNALT